MVERLHVNGSVENHLLVKDLIECIIGSISEYSKAPELTQGQVLRIEYDVDKVLEKHNQLLKITFNEYQAKAKTTALYYKKIDETFPNLDPKVRALLGLSYVSLGLGESGEVQGKVKKLIRDAGGNITPGVIDAIKGELGDILWYVSQVCEELGITMEGVAYSNTAKLADRAARNVITGSGDNR